MQVYRIFNKINGKSYVGITKWTFSVRYPQGKWWKWTQSSHLKCAVEKYGLENFETQILTSSVNDLQHLLELEKDYIKLYHSYIPDGYNLTRGGGSKTPTFVKEYELIDCDGSLYKIKNLSNFCKHRNINYGAMLNMVSGLAKSSQGFALSTTPIEYIKLTNKTWELENAYTGECVKISDEMVHEWAVMHHMNSKHVRGLLRKSHKMSRNGWKLKSTILGEKYRGVGTKYKDIKLINLWR